MLQTVAIVVVVLIAAVLIMAALKPASFRYERSTRIKAPPQKVFPLIDDFHKWTGWSPWEKLDPPLKRTYSGAPSGKGAVYEWQGDKKVGSGRMEITESRPAAKVLIMLGKSFDEELASMKALAE